MNDIATLFEQRIESFEKAYRDKAVRYNMIATVRVLVFIAFLVLIVFFASQKNGTALGITVLLFPLAFGFIVKAHQRIAYRRRHAQFLREINQAEKDIAQLKLSGQDGGLEYQDILHPYSQDLDLFGKNSLFQLLNRTETKGGRDMLAAWLLKPSTKDSIIERQVAIGELAQQIDWRQDFQASARHYIRQQSDTTPLLDWISRKEPLSKTYQIAAYVMPVLIMTSAIANLTTAWPVVATVILAVISAVVLNRFQKRLLTMWEQIAEHVSMLGAYADLLTRIEQSTFESSRLVALKGSIVNKNTNASSAIRKLYKILDFLNARSNFFYMMIDVVLLFDIHIINMAEGWKKKNEVNLEQWFGAIAEFEVLSSLAAFSFAHPQYQYAEIINNPVQIKAANMGHPLIHPSECIRNDFEMNQTGSIGIITGSNMSGKSTFLRTLGVNTVLALAGAPVCAQSFTISEVQLFTGMRTQDNLEEHISSFYAELKRIRQLLDMVDGDQPVLYMLDEILKGTNSHDRHLGAVSLAKQLSQTNSFGLISTHDLSLGELESEMPHVRNYSFNSDIVDDKIHFPYKLEDGICRSFNASKLMELIGIDIKKGG